MNSTELHTNDAMKKVWEINGKTITFVPPDDFSVDGKLVEPASWFSNNKLLKSHIHETAAIIAHYISAKFDRYAIKVQRYKKRDMNDIIDAVLMSLSKNASISTKWNATIGRFVSSFSNCLAELVNYSYVDLQKELMEKEARQRATFGSDLMANQQHQQQPQQQQVTLLIDFSCPLNDLANYIAKLMKEPKNTNNNDYFDEEQMNHLIVKALQGEFLSYEDVTDILQPPPPPQEQHRDEYLKVGMFDLPYQNIMLSPSSQDTNSTMIVADSPQALLIESINFARREFNEQCQYAPFFAIIQGSGSGKTRMAIACKSDFFTIYICLRFDRNGYPQGSSMRQGFVDNLATMPSADCSATSTSSNVGHYVHFYYCLFDFIAKYPYRCVSNRHVNNDESSVAHVSKEKKMENFFDCFANTGDTFGVWREIFDNINVLLKQAIVNLSVVDKINQASDALSSVFGTCCVPPFLIIIDEVSALFGESTNDESAFMKWRRSLIECHSPMMFHLVLDTDVKVVSTLPPPCVRERSARRKRNGMKLLPPLYSFSFTGRWTLPKALENRIKDKYTCTINTQVTLLPFDRHLETRLRMSITFNSALDLLQYSRPMYFVDANGNKGEIQSTIELAVWKLCSDVVEKGLDMETDIPKLLCPALAYRYHLTAVDIALREDLVANHGATLRGFDMDNYPEAVIVEYIPEPMVGEAASRMVERFKSHELEILHEIITKGTFRRCMLPQGNRACNFVSFIYMLRIFECTRKIVVYRSTTTSVAAEGGEQGKTGEVEEKASCPKTTSMTSDLVPIYMFLATLMSIRNSEHAHTFVQYLQQAVLNTQPSPPSIDDSNMYRSYQRIRLLYGMIGFTGWYTANGHVTYDKLEGAYHSRIAWMSQLEESAVIDGVITVALPSINCVVIDTNKDRDPKTKKRRVASPLFPDSAEATITACALQVKYCINDIALGTALMWLKNQVEYIRNKTMPNTRDVGIVSILHMVGPGRVTNPAWKKNEGSPDVIVLSLDKYPMDLFVIDHGFTVEEPNQQKLYNKIAQFTQLQAMPVQSWKNVFGQNPEPTTQDALKHFSNTLNEFTSRVEGKLQFEKHGSVTNIDAEVEEYDLTVCVKSSTAEFLSFNVSTKNGFAGTAHVYNAPL